MKTANDVLNRFAQDIAGSVADKVISFLVESTDTLSGDDSVLTNVWEEICMQMQHERSIFWDDYDDTVKLLIEGYLIELKDHEKYAIWFQTDAGWSWNYDCEHGATPETDLPIGWDDTVTYIKKEYIYLKASTYTNKNIESFIESHLFD